MSSAEEVGRKRVELLSASDEREAEGEDGQLYSLVPPRCDGQREERGVRGEQGEDERFLRGLWEAGWGESSERERR